MAPELPPQSSDNPASPPDWDALARYLAGESDAAEAQALARWLEIHPSDAGIVRALDRLADEASAESDVAVDVEAALERVKRRRDERNVIPITRPGPSRRWRAVALPIAAAVLLAVSTTFVTQLRRARPEPVGSVAATVYQTPVGKQDSVRLVDGTAVVLAPGSKLTVPAEYAAGTRSVDLEGEAYFDVRHDDAHAFRIRAGSATIQDVGTTFSVRSSGTDVRVAVTSGAVLLSPNAGGADSGVVLHEGDVGTLDQRGRVRTERRGAKPDELAWTQGRLVFHNAPVPVVVDAVRRWFGVELKIADSAMASQHLNTQLAATDSADQVLRTIALMLGARVERHGDTAVLVRSAGPAR